MLSSPDIRSAWGVTCIAPGSYNAPSRPMRVQPGVMPGQHKHATARRRRAVPQACKLMRGYLAALWMIGSYGRQMRPEHGERLLLVLAPHVMGSHVHAMHL